MRLSWNVESDGIALYVDINPFTVSVFNEDRGPLFDTEKGDLSSLQLWSQLYILAFRRRTTYRHCLILQKLGRVQHGLAICDNKVERGYEVSFCEASVGNRIENKTCVSYSASRNGTYYLST